jgi:hypothetical protein
MWSLGDLKAKIKIGFERTKVFPQVESIESIVRKEVFPPA